jgi:hypothetical protein
MAYLHLLEHNLVPDGVVANNATTHQNHYESPSRQLVNAAYIPLNLGLLGRKGKVKQLLLDPSSLSDSSNNLRDKFIDYLEARTIEISTNLVVDAVEQTRNRWEESRAAPTTYVEHEGLRNKQ